MFDLLLFSSATPGAKSEIAIKAVGITDSSLPSLPRTAFSF